MKPFETKINEFPVDKELKHEVAVLVRSYIARMGIEMNDDQQQKFQDEHAESLIESVLESLIDWERKKLN